MTPKVGNLYLTAGKISFQFIFEIVKVDKEFWWWQRIDRHDIVMGPCRAEIIAEYTLIYETPEAG